MQKILYKSADIRQEIIRLFSTSKGRRVAIVAFVGESAAAYLPKPNRLELVCWPKAGGTNPDMLRKLIKQGVQVSFVDGLHMKVYWTEDRGTILTSANLSTNALGAGDLKEIGILIDSRQIDIDSVLSHIKPRKWTDAELKRLEQQHRLYTARNKGGHGTRQAISFGEWYRLAGRSGWKLGWWDTWGDISLNAKQLARTQYGVASPNDFLGCQANDYRAADWVMCFRSTSKRPGYLSWMYVDHVVPVSRKDKKAYASSYPYQAIQMWSLRVYAGVPFRIDKPFRSAFAKAVNHFGADKIKHLKSQAPTTRLLDSIAAYYNSSRA